MPGVGNPLILSYGLPGVQYPIPRDSRVGHGHGHALRFGYGRAFVHLAVLRGAVGPDQALLGADVTLLAVPPHSVEGILIEPCGNIRADYGGDLLKGAGEVHIIHYEVPHEHPVPAPTPGGAGDALVFEGAASGVQGHALHSDHLEDPSRYSHLFLIHEVGVAALVEAVAVVGGRPGNDLALAGLPNLAPVHPLRDLLALPGSDYVQDVVAELPVGRVVPSAVQSDEPRPMLAKLLGEELGVDAAGYPVAEEYHYRVCRLTPHQRSNLIKPWALQICPGITRIFYLFDYLIAVLQSPRIERIALVREGVALLALLVTRHTGVKDRSLWTVAVSARHRRLLRGLGDPCRALPQACG